MSKNFGAVDFAHLTFPNHLRIDYIRVYQPSHAINIGCNPPNFPTRDYINQCVFPLRVKQLLVTCLIIYTGISKLTRTQTLPLGEVIMVKRFRRTLFWNHAAVVVNRLTRQYGVLGISPYDTLTFYHE